MSNLTFLGFVGIDETVRKQVRRHVLCFISIICKVCCKRILETNYLCNMS